MHIKINRNNLTIRIGFVIFTTLYYSSNVSGDKFKTDLFISSHQRKVREGYTTLEVQTLPKIQCVNSCALSSLCFTVSWKSTSKTCVMYEVKDVDCQNSSWLYEPAADWTSFSKVCYPVCYFEGPSGRYSLTYNQAVALCKQNGFTIASRTDMIEARALNYHLCRCGWLLDGTIGMLISFYDTCGVGISLDIISCSISIADVYCKL